MRMDLKHTLVVSLFSALLSACSASSMATELPMTDTPTSTYTPSITPSPTTLIPTHVPYTLTPAQSPTMVPTPPFGTAKVGEDFLFGNLPADCQLPCWHGLRIGHSQPDDIQTTLESAFGFEHSVALYQERRTASLADGLTVVSNTWLLQEQQYLDDEFFVGFYVRDNSQSLEAIQFTVSGSRFRPYTSPQYLIRKLGQPTHMLASIQESEVIGQGGMRLIMIYQEGVAVDYGVISVNIYHPKLDEEGYVQFCLNNLSDIPAYMVHVHLTQPFADDLSNLTGYQQEYIGGNLAWVSPIQDIFGVSLEEITELAQESSSPCITASVQ